MRRSVLALGSALLWFAPPVRADVLCLRDGRIFDGVQLAREDGVVVATFEHGDVRVPEERVLDCIVEDGAAGFEPETDEEREKLADGYVRYDGKWMRPDKRDRLVDGLREKQRARVEELKAAREWRNRLVEETDSFVFEATVPRNVFENYRDLCEEYFRQFSKDWRVRRPRGMSKLLVKFYGDHENYLQVTGVPPNVGGFFRYLDPYELNIYYDRLDPQQTEEIMYHEAGHYLQQLFDVEFAYPHWPGESLSEYYGASVWNPDTRKMESGGILEGRVIEIQHDMDEGHALTIEELLLNAPERTYHDYNWGWSFIHFLMNDPRYSSNFQKFFVALSRAKDIDRVPVQIGRHHMKTVDGEEMLDAFRRYMKIKSDEDLAEMEREWHDYVREELSVATPRGLARAAWLAVLRDRPQRAKRLFEEAIAAGNEHSLTFFRYGNVLDELDDEKGAREQWARAIELDSLVPDYYVPLGRSLAGDPAHGEEGERLLQLAQDIEPDNFYLERNLGRFLSEARSERKEKAKQAAEASQPEDGGGASTQAEGGGGDGEGGH